MWWDLQGTSKYEVPKGSGKTSAFAAALWLAGIDINGQLKCACTEIPSERGGLLDRTADDRRRGSYDTGRVQTI